MTKPRNSVLYLFDPLHQSPSTPHRDSSPELGTSDKENDVPPGDLTVFFSRTYGPSKSQDAQPHTPKGKLIDIGDTPAPEKQWDEDDAEHDGSDADGEQSESEAEGLSTVLAALRTPLAELPVEDTPRPLRAPIFTAPASGPQRSEGRIEALLAAPQGSPLAEVINSINLSGLSLSEAANPIVEHAPTLEAQDGRPPSPFPEITICAPETPIIPETDTKQEDEPAEELAMRGVTLRPPSALTQLSPDDPRRTSVDLYSSFHLQIQSPEMSFDLLNDKISFFGSGHDSLWPAGEDAMFESDEETRRVPVLKHRERKAIAVDETATRSTERMRTPPVETLQSAATSPTEEATKVPLPTSPPPAPLTTPPRIPQQTSAAEPPSPPTSPVALDEPSLLLESEPVPPPLVAPVPALRIVKKTFRLTGRQNTPPVPVAEPTRTTSAAPALVEKPEPTTRKVSPTIAGAVPAAAAQPQPVRPAIRGVQRPPASMLAAGNVVIGLPPQGASNSSSASTSSSSSSGSSASRPSRPQDASAAAAAAAAASRFAAAGVRRPMLISKECPAPRSASAAPTRPAKGPTVSSGPTRTASTSSTLSKASSAASGASGLRPPSRIAAPGSSSASAGSALPRPASRLPGSSSSALARQASAGGLVRHRVVTAPRAPTGGRF